MVEVNGAKPDFVQQTLEKTTQALQTCLEAGDWRLYKLVLRFLACMQSIFEGDGLFDMLDELFNRAVDLQAASSRDVWFSISDDLCYANMCTLVGRIGTSQDHHAHPPLRPGLLGWL